MANSWYDDPDKRIDTHIDCAVEKIAKDLDAETRSLLKAITQAEELPGCIVRIYVRNKIESERLIDRCVSVCNIKELTDLPATLARAKNKSVPAGIEFKNGSCIEFEPI